MNIRVLSTIALIISSFYISSSRATTIDLNYDASEFSDTEGQLALNGFKKAANFWENQFSDNVTVNLDISFASLGSGIIGSASSNYSTFFYEDIANALLSDVSSNFDVMAVNSLTCENQGNGVCNRSFLENGDGGGIDNDGSGDNYAMALTQANAKALGFSTNSWGDSFESSDALITFSSDFSFDFDDTDGINSNQMDFVGVAIHEIGHALGFVSGVDTYDYYFNNNSTVDLDPYAIASTLDLFRYSSDSVSAGLGILDLRSGVDSYFSLDNGITNYAQFSTGSYGGDGRQASHWKDNLGLGILDPTFAYGEFGQATILDIVAFDAIGWDIASVNDVPEPTSLALVSIGLAGFSFLRRKKNIS